MKAPIFILILIISSLTIASVTASYARASNSCFIGGNYQYFEDLIYDYTISLAPGSPNSLTLIYCGDNKMCYKGSCVSMGCYDTDNTASSPGPSYYTQGYSAYKTNINNYGYYPDTCKGSNVLNEAKCTNGKAEYISHNCPLSCSNGKCEMECTPIHDGWGNTIGAKDYNPTTKAWTSHYDGCSGSDVVKWSCHYDSNLKRWTAYISKRTKCTNGCSNGGCLRHCPATCWVEYRGPYKEYTISAVHYNLDEMKNWCWADKTAVNTCQGNSLKLYYCDGTTPKENLITCKNGCTTIKNYFSYSYCNPKCQDIVYDHNKQKQQNWWRIYPGNGVIIHDGLNPAQTFYDKCTDSRSYVKYYCSGDPPNTKMNTETGTCASGYHCSQGSCVQDNPNPPSPPTDIWSCTHESNHNGHGYITTLYKNNNKVKKEKDTCNDNKHITQYDCNAPHTEITQSTHSCRSNEICQTNPDDKTGYCSGQ